MMPAMTRFVTIIALLLFAGAATAQPLLNAKYRLPAAAFAYVGDPQAPASWKLPYRHADGTVDRRRLPLAIEAALGTYRGQQAHIPAAALPDVLIRLAGAAKEIGKLPPHRTTTPYRKLAAALRARGLRID